MIFSKEYLEKRKRLLLEEALRASKVLKDMGAEKVFLIGSAAGETPNPYGDVDLVAVMRSEMRFLERLRVAYEAVAPRVGMDILVYTPDEFEELKSSSPFLGQALARGRELDVF